MYHPATPPSTYSDHSRSVSGSSIYSNDSSPWSVITGTTSPVSSPPRHHHGPPLLPRIRPQDVVIEPVSVGGCQRHRRVLSNTRNPPGFVPYPTSSSRSASARQQHTPATTTPTITTDVYSLVSPVSTSSFFGSTLPSPVSVGPSVTKRKSAAGGGHARSISVSSIDEATLNRYGYPTYRQLPVYVSHALQQPNPPHPQPPAPQASQSNEMDSTTLLSYLTAAVPAINLVRNVSVVPTRGMHDYFWWDVRNLRSWHSFSLATFNSIDGLSKLLTTEISTELTPPSPVSAAHLAPESEAALVSTVRDLYASRVNAALAVSQGAEHLVLYPAPDQQRATGHKHYGGPHFLANYASDTERTPSGAPRGRLVGVVKSFDRWNSGMRNEGPPRRVEYLNGLAHLQRCMREHSCRYGFIMTEIELVCVRAGCDEGDDVPYFGFLEVSAPIPTKTAAGFTELHQQQQQQDQYNSPAPSDRSRSQTPELGHFEGFHSFSGPAPMTASLALYFLLMLSKSVPLPSQPSAHLNVGGPGALTRQRVLPEGKDKWIPVPQIGEQRDAKRVRGWVLPQDPWHRREGGGGKGKRKRK
ncbi:hypothetical protein ASPZODRAFT_148792 [Penicilliopsis zonata CBS 506.65]|uniref:Sialidase n=1 Tax=Penicilliopsis zonata CBS 506.65 TaxID=1073090 RepID=A0A1L9SWE8_9EURO|nr:hypothetical protein ASPZODRAFT_148792 [Penicilliopsis zonata CBS 506.65]OJJ51525.1 hypothetical protein ASPZODRAFT_148792 [Penicilliopsis zonata CBS 506.65]